MVYRAELRTGRTRGARQLSDEELSSLEEGTSSPSASEEEGDERSTRRLVQSKNEGKSSARYFSEGKHRHGRIRRGLHKVHKRVREAKGKGKEVEITRTQRYVCWGVFLLVLGALAFWAWKDDTYDTVKDFVTFPTLTTPLDVASVWNAATSAIVSVATQIASGAVSVATQIATGATSVAGDVTSAVVQVTQAAEITKAAEITNVAKVTNLLGGLGLKARAEPTLFVSLPVSALPNPTITAFALL